MTWFFKIDGGVLKIGGWALKIFFEERRKGWDIKIMSPIFFAPLL